MISNQNRLINRRTKFIILGSGIFSHLVFVPNFFAFKISLNNETNLYSLNKSKFGMSNFFLFYNFFVLGLANLSITFLIIFTSFILFKEIRKYSNNATLMHLTVFSKIIIKRRRLETKLLKMVLILSFIYASIRVYDFFYILIDILMLFELFSNLNFYLKVFRNTLANYFKSLKPISSIEIVRL